MLFPTIDFLLFFCVVFTLSWLSCRFSELNKWVLLTASFFFYAYWDVRFCLLLAASAFINYIFAIMISAVKKTALRRFFLIVALALNLSILAFFKYYNFFLENLSDVLTIWGVQRDLVFLEIILPVGISFFTFQGISYIVDVYKSRIPVCYSIIDIFLYISFFPQLVAGPIVRASVFLPQLATPRLLDRKLRTYGFCIFLLGLFKKMYIANYLATEIVDDIFFDPIQYSSIDLLVGVYAYAIQIYCDFSGYSDMAIGIAALLGFRFERNFNRPYRAANLIHFWRLWHISLSHWLRDYIYIPLGGNRGKYLNTARNIFITMFLGGIWHGANWTFIVWGSLHGFMLIITHLFIHLNAKQVDLVSTSSSFNRILSLSDKLGTFVFHILGIFITFNFVSFCWIFFRSETIFSAFNYIEALFLGQWSESPEQATPIVVFLILITLCCQFIPRRLGLYCLVIFERIPPLIFAILCGIFILIIDAISPSDVAPFIYFQF